MLTGKRAFAGDDVSETLATVLQRRAGLDALPADGPATLRQSSSAMPPEGPETARRRHRRHASGAGGRVRRPPATAAVTRDVAPDVRWTRTAGVPPCGSRGSGGVRSRRWGCLDALASDAQGPRSIARLAITLPRRPAFRRPRESRPGRFARGHARRVRRRRAAADSNSTCEPSMASSRRRWRARDGATNPFFSPDGHWIGFFAQGKLKKVSVEAGRTRRCATAPTHAVEAGRVIHLLRGHRLLGSRRYRLTAEPNRSHHTRPSQGRDQPPVATGVARRCGAAVHRLDGPGSDERQVDVQRLDSGSARSWFREGNQVATSHRAT